MGETRKRSYDIEQALPYVPDGRPLEMAWRRGWPSLLMLLMSISTSCSDQREWHTFRSETWAFSAEFPTPPVQQPLRIETRAGMAEGEQFCSWLTDVRRSPKITEPITRRLNPKPMSVCIFAVNWPSPLKTDAERAQAVDELRRAYEATLTDHTVVADPAADAGGWIIKTVMGKGQLFSRVQLRTSGRVFMLIATGRSASEIDSETATRFLRSFATAN